jgi:hypothetical protein
MAIRNDDWAAIDRHIADAVNAAVAPLRPQGAKRVMAFVRELGTIVAVISLIVALVGITLASLYQAFAHVEKEAQFRGETTTKLTEIADHLKKIDNTLSSIQLASAAGDPVNPKNALEAKRLVTAAHQNAIQLPPAVVQENGLRFVEVSERSPEAWATVLAFLSYKSFVNTLAINIPDYKVDNAETNIIIGAPPGQQPPKFFFAGIAPKDSAAQAMMIGKDKDAGESFGVAYLLANGGTALLDGMQFRNVIFRDVRIMYSGGPLKMTNVFFLNCTFEMKPETNTLKLASAALEPGAATSFSAGL